MSGTTDAPPVRRLADWDDGRLTELARTHGTPLYVIDLARIRENCARLRSAFPDADVRYAAKANAAGAVLETVKDAGLGVECASAGEVVRARRAGFPGDRLHYTAVNPPARDLDRVLAIRAEATGLTITAGAVDTLDRLAERGYDGRLCVRVNPGVGAGHHEKVRTGADATFGVPYDRAESVVREATSRFDVVGIHAHAGSGIDADQLDRHRELVARMGALATSLSDIDLEYVDVGGGFGVPYRETEPPLDLSAVAAATRRELADALDDPKGAPNLAVEPGRYVVADAGVLLTEVNTVKPTPGSTVVGVDAGMTDLLRPAMYDAYHPIRPLNGDGEDVPTTVAGPICESSDVFCTDRPLPRVERDDRLAVGIVGAYGYEMASHYNTRPRPAEVAVDGDTSRVIRERETIADVLATEPDTDRP